MFGKIIKDARLKKELSCERLSAKLELMGITIHRQGIFDIENNKRTVKDYELFGLAYILDIDLNNLLNEFKKII